MSQSPKGKLGNTSPNLIRHDYKRAVYRTLLSEFSIEEVKDFFSRVPLIIKGVECRGKALFQLLWKKKAYGTMCWDSGTDNILEEFLLSKGRNPNQVMPKILWLNGGSAPIPGRIILSWFYPKVETLFNSLDTRDMCIGLITVVTESWLPGLIHRRIRKKERGEWIETVMVFINDPTHQEYLDWDFEFIAGPQVITAPAIVGLPPFERFGMLADTRPPGQIVWLPEDKPVLEGDTLFIRGEAAGRKTRFLAFCRDSDLDVGKYNPPDLEVVVMSKDYHCPKRNRTVLHQGCAYGSPFFIHWMEHRKLVTSSRGVLANLVSDIDREETDEEEEIEEKHRALLASIVEHTVFTYHPSDESMSLNGKHFAKGIPAKILRSLLLAYTQAGKTEFEYRDFKRDFEISLGQKNSNFEVRFYRLVEKLGEQGSVIRIEKTGRGCFLLHVQGEIKMVESVGEPAVPA